MPPVRITYVGIRERERECIIISSGSIIAITRIRNEENRKALITMKYICAARPDVFFEYLRNRVSSRLISWRIVITFI